VTIRCGGATGRRAVCDFHEAIVSHSPETSPLERCTDAELLDRIREPAGHGDEQVAASVLFGRYRDRVYQWCVRRVRDHEQAMDLAQEVLIGAYRKLDSFDGRSSFSSWLFAITRNRCLNALRRPPLFDASAPDPDALADRQRGPDRALEEREAEERLLALIARHLDPVEQEVLWLRCFERMPVDAISVTLGIDQASGARGILQRARRHLRAALASDQSAEAEVATGRMSS
jgi:RNA polymerase sigma-70 factor (ECF subfamily)